RGDNSLDLPKAEAIAMPRHTFRDAVAHERGGRRASRADPHAAADHARAQRCQPVLRKLTPCLEYGSGIDSGRAAFEGQSFLDREQNFRDTKQSDHCDKEIKTVEKFGKSKGQPQLSGHRVQPNGSQSEADHHRANGLERRLLAHSNKAAESKKI